MQSDRRTDGQADTQTDVTELIFVLSNFANASRNL